MPNAITIIKRDHRAVETEYKKYQGTESKTAKAKIARKIFDALTKHAKMEEEFFYPAVREDGSAKVRKMLDEAETEHAEMKGMIERFKGKEETIGFGMKVAELLAGVMHHVKEEEEELLPEARKSMTSEQLDELGSAMDALSPSRGKSSEESMAKRAKAEAKMLTG